MQSFGPVVHTHNTKIAKSVIFKKEVWQVSVLIRKLCNKLLKDNWKLHHLVPDRNPLFLQSNHLVRCWISKIFQLYLFFVKKCQFSQLTWIEKSKISNSRPFLSRCRELLILDFSIHVNCENWHFLTKKRYNWKNFEI